MPKHYTKLKKGTPAHKKAKREHIAAMGKKVVKKRRRG
jgi:hypothetical protein